MSECLMRQAGFLLPLPACVTSNGLLSFREPSFLYVLNKPTFSSFQFSRSVVFDFLRPHELQHARLPCPSPTPGVYPNSRPLSRWCHLTILSSPSPPALNLSQHQGLFKWVSSLQQVAKLLEFQLQHQSYQWTPRADLLSPRDSQESSPTPQFKSINSSALSFLCSPTLTSRHDYWKNHSLN